MLIMLPTQACLRAEAPLNPETAEEKAISRIFGPYAILRHASPQTTQTIYMQPVPESVKSTMVAFEERLKAGRGPSQLLTNAQR
jgi:hypothetical protein